MSLSTSAHAAPLWVPDASAFAKSLRKQLVERTQHNLATPSHVELLNMLARAAGYPNVQSLKASGAPAARAKRAVTLAPLTATATKAAMQFDAQGQLVRWPNKRSVQRLAMWVLWMHFDAKRQYTEREVNHILNAWHSFGDHATLRRELVNLKLLARKSDCSVYWKEPHRPDDEVRPLLSALRERIRAASPEV